MKQGARFTSASVSRYQQYKMHKFVLISLLTFAGASSAAKDIMSNARDAFKHGNCVHVIRLIGKADAIATLQNTATMVEAYKKLGICYFQVGQHEKSENELQNLLGLRPDYALDPFDTPAPVLELFTQLKQKSAIKLKELELIRQRALAQEVNSKLASDNALTLVQREVIRRRVSPLAAFVPFGFGQFENGEIVKGSILAGSQFLFLGLNIGSYWWKQSLVVPGTSNLVANEAALQTYNTAKILQWSSLSLVIGIYIYGVIDALVNRRPIIEEQVVTHSDTELTKKFMEHIKAERNS